MLTMTRRKNADLDPFREVTPEEQAENERQDKINEAINRRAKEIGRTQAKLPPQERMSKEECWEQASKEVHAAIRRNLRAERRRRLLADAASTHTRNRHLLGPWKAGAVYAASGELGAVLTEASGHVLAGEGLAAAGAGVASALAWRKIKQLPEKYWTRLRAGVAAGCVTCLTLPVLPWDWHGAALAGGVAALVGASARYRRDNAPKYPPMGGYGQQDHQVAVAQTVAKDNSLPVEARDIIDDWNGYVSADGALPGAELIWREAFDNGHVFTVKLVRGKQKFPQLQKALEDIAYALNLPVSSLTADPSPDPTQPLQPLLTVTTSRPDTTYTGPVIVRENGSVFVELGPYTDGRGVVRYELLSGQLTDEELARGEQPSGNIIGGFLMGDKGSGKTKELEMIALGAMEVGIEVWYLDPQGGASSPLLRDHAAWSLMGLHSPDGREYGNVIDLAEALEGFTAVRQDENAAHGWPRFQHSRQRPGVLVIVDECHQAFNALDPTTGVKFGIRFGEIDRVFQKIGGAFLGASQAPTQDVFGGSNTLRNGMAGANGYALKYNGSNARLAFGGLDDVIARGVQSLPINRGLGYAVNSERPHAVFQNRYNSHMEPFFTERSQAGRSLLDHLATVGAGPAYANRAASSQQNLAAVQARLQGYLDGSLKPGEAKSGNKKPRKSTEKSGETGSVYLFPGTQAQPQQPSEQQVTRDSLTERQLQILNMLATAHLNAKELASELGVTNRTVSNDLRVLREGKLARVVDEQEGKYTASENV